MRCQQPQEHYKAMPVDGSKLACASVEHDANRHVICAQTSRYAQAGYAQRAVQLMCPAQQLIAVRLEAEDRQTSGPVMAMPFVTPASVMHSLTARFLHEVACMYDIRRLMAACGTHEACIAHQQRKGSKRRLSKQKPLRAASVQRIQGSTRLRRAFTLCPLCMV